jgi:hypothetical protein
MFAIGDEEWAGLSKLIEETGELLQVAGKLMGSRGVTDHWSGDLRAKLVEELGDAVGAIGFFVEKNLTAAEQQAVGDRTALKFERFQQWHIEDPDPCPTRLEELQRTGRIA